jgi:hypothetical protein
MIYDDQSRSRQYALYHFFYRSYCFFRKGANAGLREFSALGIILSSAPSWFIISITFDITTAAPYKLCLALTFLGFLHILMVILGWFMSILPQSHADLEESLVQTRRDRKIQEYRGPFYYKEGTIGN